MDPIATLMVVIAADVGMTPLIIAVIGSGGLSAVGTAAVAFRRMKVQNTVDVRTVAAKEAEVAVQGFRELLGVQAQHLKLQADQIDRQNAEITRLRGVVEHCERKCAELTVEVGKRDKP